MDAFPQRREEEEGALHTIGEINPSKGDCALHFDTRSKPASLVCDDDGNLICFFAEQTSDDDRSKEEAAANAEHEDAPAKDHLFYFFSPLYFGESPVACLGPPVMKAGRKTVTLYTFKRKYNGQQPAEKRGYFGERMYAHAQLTLNRKTNQHEFYRLPQHDKSGTERSMPVLAAGSGEEWGFQNSRLFQLFSKPWRCGAIYDNDFLKSVNFHSPGEAGTCVDIDGNSMKVTAGCDIIECVCLWCAYNIYHGFSITAV